jgi:hypothetical protein
MNARKLPGDKAWPAGKADNLTVTRIVLLFISLDSPVSRLYCITIVMFAFCSLQVGISSLLGFIGGRETYILSNLFAEVTPEIIYTVKPYVIDGILEFIRNAVNEQIIPLGLTFTDLVNCLLGFGNCPLELP